MFHKNLLRIRTCNNYTVEQVAKKMNISPELYEKWESGEVVPTVDVLPRLSLCFGFYLCDAFMGISINEFFVPQKEKMNMGETLRVLEEFAQYSEQKSWPCPGDKNLTQEEAERFSKVQKIFERIEDEDYINENIVMGFYECSREQAQCFLQYAERGSIIFTIEDEEERSEYLEDCCCYKKLPENITNYFFGDDVFAFMDEIVLEFEKSKAR